MWADDPFAKNMKDFVVPSLGRLQHLQEVGTKV
jgi:hypothetical protein